MSKKITSPANLKYKQLKRLLSSTSYRKKTGLSVVYGKKPINLLIENSPEVIEYILFSERNPIQTKSGIPIIQISESLLQALPEGTIADQGVVAVIKQRYADLPSLVRDSKRILILDGIQDPDNLGTIVRTAVAFNIKSIITTTDSANPFHPKAIRASAGYILLARISRAHQKDILNALEKHRYEILMATPRQRTNKNTTQCLISTKTALVLGNEGHGIKDIWKKSSKGKFISIRTKIESLNVAAAAAILLFGITGGELLCQDA